VTVLPALQPVAGVVQREQAAAEDDHQAAGGEGTDVLAALPCQQLDGLRSQKRVSVARRGSNVLFRKP
jgi:hypothetical protein